MKIKNYAKFAALAAVVSTSMSASPFLAIGDGAELFVTGTVGVRADDNIYLSHKAESDTVFEITPGVLVTFGKDGQLKGSLTLADSFSSYADHSKLNTNLFSGDFQTNFEDAKSKLEFKLGYHEMNQNTLDTRPGVTVPLTPATTVPALIRRDQFVVGANGEVAVSPLLSISAGVNYDHTKYKHAGYGDIDMLNVPLEVYYKWTAKTDLSFGYSYRDTQAQIGKDSNDQFYKVGVRGEISPLLSGKIDVGVINRNISGGGSKTDPGLDASLSYAASAKTSVTLNASNDYSTNPTGLQQRIFSLGGQVATALSAEWSGFGGLSYRNLNYYANTVGTVTTPGRSDDYWEAQVGAGYTVNHIVKINGTYTYRDNSSPLTTAAFTNNVFAISAQIRY